MEKIIDFDDLTFDLHGRVTSVVIPDDLLDQISGGRRDNGDCGTGCQGSTNKTCGNTCAVQSQV